MVGGYQFNFTNGRTFSGGRVGVFNVSDHNTTSDDRLDGWDEQTPDYYIVFCRLNYRREISFGGVLRCVYKRRGETLAESRPLRLNAARSLLDRLDGFKTNGERLKNVDSIIEMIKSA